MNETYKMYHLIVISMLTLINQVTPLAIVVDNRNHSSSSSSSNSSSSTTNPSLLPLEEEEQQQINHGFSFTNESYNYKRPAPPSYIEGTMNWERLTPTNGLPTFSPRHSHATCIFKCPTSTTTTTDDTTTTNNKQDKQCIWITGGRTELYRTFDLQKDDRKADIWWSEDGANWNQVTEIYGDFLQSIGNYNAKVGGEVAPWYSRYGHSMDTMDVDNDGVDDLMILMGGFNPLPSNDIWITTNGTMWFFERFALWSGRAYHATTVFKNRLLVVGGTPLNNEVWSGYVVRDSTQRSGFRIGWTQLVKDGKAPWAPRCGMCVLTHTRKANYHILDSNGNITEINDKEAKEVVYMIGGFAGWPKKDVRWNGDRTRNDVWISEDGKTWNRVLPPEGQTTMPFIGRGWHACSTWHSNDDVQKGVKLLYIKQDEQDDRGSKIFISGGGYIGTKGNNRVENLEGYVDVWWSYDASKWYKVNYNDGYGETLYSTNEWTMTFINQKYIFRGIWGHSLISFPTKQDLNLDGSISNVSIPLEFCSGTQANIGQCQTFLVDEERVPSLLMVGGDATEGGPIINYVFRSQPGVICEQNGVSCSNNGACGPGSIGCVCDSSGIHGEYCEVVDEGVFTSSSAQSKTGSVIPIIFQMIISITLFQIMHII